MGYGFRTSREEHVGYRFGQWWYEIGPVGYKIGQSEYIIGQSEYIIGHSEYGIGRLRVRKWATVGEGGAGSESAGEEALEDYEEQEPAAPGTENMCRD
eukprot:3912423-Rhodomonas_salina.1